MAVIFLSYCKKLFPFTGEQFKVLIALFLGMFSSAFSITMLFPFIPFMIRFLLPTIDATSVGVYAGIVASSMCAGRFFGSYVWGLLSDVWGKRRVLIICEFLLGLTSLVFGFSVNIYMAIIMRFLVGLTHGIVGIARAAVSEVCTDKTQPLALGILTTGLGFGLVVGPAVSSVIADPITQYNLTINNNFLKTFLTTFPYSLPGIVNFLLCILGMILALLLIPSTSKQAHLQYITVPQSQEPLVLQQKEKEEKNEKQSKKPCSIIQKLYDRFKIGIARAVNTFIMFIKDSTTRLVLMIYCTYSFVGVGFNELYPLWCSTSPKLGGLGFSLHDIGISLAVIGVLLVPFSLLMFPILEKCFGSIKSFQIAMITQLFFTLLMPSIHFMLLIRQDVVLWIALCLFGFIIKVATSVGLSATGLFINNSVTFDKRGSLNGLAISLTSVFRTISPLFVGSIYSASLSNSTQSIGFPVDYHLVFLLLSVVLLIVVLMSTRLPLTINQKLIEKTV